MDAPGTSALYDISSKVVIATTTFYRQGSELEHRAGNARNLVRNARDAGYDVVVVDAGSSDWFLKDVDALGAHLHAQSFSSMGGSRRQALQAAHDLGKQVVAWIEPEKETYIPELWKTAVPLLEDKADLVVPSRKDMYSYPTAQQNSEPLGNSFWHALTGQRLDVCFGPRTWQRDMSRYFLDYSGEYGDKWDSIFIPVLDAVIDGRRVVDVVVDYVHPKTQKELEDANTEFYFRRLSQLENIMHALEKHWVKRHSL